MKFIVLIIFLLFSITVSQAQWKQTNGPHGVSSIMSLGSNGEYIYAGKNGVANVFVSQNSGDSWDNKSNGLENIIQVSCFEFNIDNIFIGTAGGGVFMSSDNGDNWVSKNSGLSNLFIESIYYIDNKLFICSDEIYLSTDLGNSWIPIETGFNISRVSGWTYKDNILFAGQYGITGQPNLGLGVIKTTNMGENWQIVNKGLTNLNILSIVSNDEFVYVGTGDGVFISSDNGDNWNAFNNGLTDLHIMCLALNGDYIFAGTYNGLFYSTNNGLNWMSAGDLLKNKSIADILIRNNEIYVATNSGIFLSTDNGTSWESKNSNIISTHILDIALAEDKIIAATYANGTFQSSDRGEDWSEVEIASEESILGMVSKDNLIISKGYGWTNKIFLSEDYGNTWNNVSSDIDASLVLGVYIIDNNLIAGTDMGTFKSTNLGENWVKIDTIYGMQKIVRHDDKLFAAPPYEGLLVSLDNGTTWNKYTEFLNNRLVTAYAFVENFVYVAAYERGLYISSDNGENWELSDFDISNNTVYSINVVGGSIFMSVYGRGVFQSTDNGVNWNEINTGFTNLYITDLLVYGDEIFASTGGSGVYKAKLIDFGVVNSVENQTEEMNYLYSYPAYPMPASNEVRTLVYWDLSFDTEKYDIAVYDVLGNKVSDASSIRIEPHTAFSGNVIWNCSGVEPGIYLMRIKHGTEAKTIKVMVQR
ncbi:MAG: hypothetical protein CVV22_05780 [Ignavibacteriae bacterium HGW-Ignavibacteriae-1]|jgi:photosystem II stability/assembly factor-like uncharacterized protein|nr:MAG: hypothetical protein CVV22_05780 [Ignavibacteriae bacterium HGW-Ignavibacteriae-1]